MTKVHTKRSGMDHTVLPANNTMPAFHLPQMIGSGCMGHGNLQPIKQRSIQRYKSWANQMCFEATNRLCQYL